MQKAKVSIILVHYRVKNVLFACIKSIYESKPKTSFEIVVVDNDEVKSIETNLKKKFPKVKYVAAPGDLGYGKGNNLGVKNASGEYVFILNPDTLVEKGVIDKLLKFLLLNKKTGIVAPTLYDGKNNIYPLQGTGELTPLRGIVGLSFLNKILPDNPISKKYWLKDTDRSKPFEVDVVPGSAFLIKKSLFEKIGGFDKNFFLYFEEADFCRRVVKGGLKLFILPDAKIIHFWAASTPASPELKRIFAESRFYYFKKNFGILSALAVNFFAGVNKYNVALITILILGTFLRFYRMIPNSIFNGEMGTDYINVWNIVHGTRTFLIGPRTSHEWFFIPPISYWVYAGLMLVGNFKPLIINIFWAFVGSFAILIAYFYSKKLFDEKVALITSFLLAVSPAWIDMTREARYNAPAAIIFFPYLWYLQKSVKDNGKSLGILGFILGLSMNFFPSPFLLIPAAVICFIFFKIKPNIRYILNFAIWFIVPNITFVIYEIMNKFQITIQLLEWIPFRIFGFFGLYHKNTVSPEILRGNIFSIYNFFKETFVPTSAFLSVVIFSLFVAGSVIWFKKSLINKYKNMAFILVIINLVVSYLGLFIHGDPPEHYYLVIFPVPLILAGYLITKTFKNSLILTLTPLLIGGMGLLGLIGSNWFYRDVPLAEYTQSLPPYNLQVDAVNEIVSDSRGQEFSISRIGIFDKFENNFANNYIYLLTLRNSKIKNGAALRYTIVENRLLGQAPTGEKIWESGGIEVYKSLNIQK